MKNFLFIPGNNPKMLSGANFLGSDAIVIDLEDAVAPSEKVSAVILTRNAIKTLCYNKPVGVRINAINTEHWQNDLSEILPLNIDFIILPKTECSEDIAIVDKYIDDYCRKNSCKSDIWIMALIETASGVENAFSIAKSSPRVKALFLGAEDFTYDLYAKRTSKGTEILYARSRVVCAARAAGIEVFDTPYTDIDDEEGLIEDSALARQLGFTGKASINPKQISIINEAFIPTAEEISHAKEVLKVYEDSVRCGIGAVALHGKMIDTPVLNRARKVLDDAKGVYGNE